MNFGALIYIFYTRVQHSGRVCSGDFLADNDDSSGYMIETGFVTHIALAIFIVTFVIGMIFCVVSALCVMLGLKKRDPLE